MLYPQTNSARSVLDLNGLWRFRLLDDAVPPDGPLRRFEWLAVPASYNDLREDPRFHTHRGWAAYQRDFTIPHSLDGQRLWLRFDGVTHRARVFLNGELLCEHTGGFLPFEAEITGRAACGAEARLTVLVDNAIDRSTLPVGNDPDGVVFLGTDNAEVPSVQAAKQWRPAPNLPNFDFFNYAGIQRPVRLYATPFNYISGLTLTPTVDGKDGLLGYRVSTAGDLPADSVFLEVLDAQGRVAASGAGAEGQVRIPGARLWEPRPGTPYLYTARVRYGNDIYVQTFGVRSVEVRETRFLINGKPFYFKGFGRHEDSAIHGRGFDLCVSVKDIGMMRWLHANSFRTSHYPNAEEMYDLCDREGIVVIDETPAVGISAAGGRDPYENAELAAAHERVLRDLIARDQNHPCVVMWSLGNEPDTVAFPESACRYWRSLYELAHALDPQSRPVTMVCCQNDYERDIVSRTMDVVCVNRYYGWYNLSGDLDAACYALDLELDFWERQGKPVMISEYGADTLPGVHGTVPEMFSEEFQAEYYRRLNEVFDRRSFMVGEHAWVFADFATQQGVLRADGNRKGLLTRDRRPKLAAHYFRERWRRMEASIDEKARRR